jgi:transketolase
MNAPNERLHLSHSQETVSTRRMADALRFLAADAVEQAKSGHPGMPMGMAEIAVALWTRHLKHNPAGPTWADRDRFVLSNGHGSMLLYALLHLTGYDLPLEELQRFRQLGSKTPGHPEVGLTPGVETTTGPLGQGLANAVGMALAEKLLAQHFNRTGHAIVDHYTYVFLGDGCLMEGISHEACSIAGTWKLGKLIAFYDDNGISIDGEVEGWFTDDTPQRFAGYGWHVIPSVNGHDVSAVDAAIVTARAVVDRPTLICCKTIIGHGSPNKAGTADVHGAPLGKDEVAATRAARGWEHPAFEIPEEVRAGWTARARGAARQREWESRFMVYRAAHPELAQEFERRARGELPADFAAQSADVIARTAEAKTPIATRKASQQSIAAYAAFVPELLGGSADLTGSNLTDWPAATTFPADRSGNYIHYGVREFGMSAIMNGVALHGGLIPFGGTFLTFSDYSRNAIRMAALMRKRVIHVFTHDSIGLGEDGPTHQPVEHLASLRLIPNVRLWRPCDATETAVAWREALQRTDGPTLLTLSRQNLTPQYRGSDQIAAIGKGGYTLAEADAPLAMVIIATGSEVELAMQSRAVLEQEHIGCRVVSMPCAELFEQQPTAYQDALLPRAVPCIAVEAGVRAYWRRFVGREGAVVGVDRFGESAPGRAVYKHLGMTVDSIVEAAHALLQR